MSYLSDVFKYVMSRTQDFTIHRQKSVFLAKGLYYLWMPDDELQAQCRAALEADPTLQDGNRTVRESLLIRLVLRLIKLLGISLESSKIEFRNLALGIVAFGRAPADLPKGSSLFPEQVDAAIAMLNPCVLQMDTGEGKTYALLPTAFALACKYWRVYIVCANDYLAWRDANRTRNYWKYVGIIPGLGLVDNPDISEEEWSRRVVYTTAENMKCKLLRDDLMPFASEHPLIFSAALIDEIDATLLDDGNRDYLICEYIRSQDIDWTTAIKIAQDLTEGDDLSVDRINLIATLSVQGEDKVRDHLNSISGSSNESYLLMRRLVELAYIATVVVEENFDYVRQGNRIYAVNQRTGRVEPTVAYDWLIPLEFQLGLRTRPKTVSLHSCNNAVLFRQFNHIAGASGTVVEDALEYFYKYRLLTYVIPRRSPRFDGFEADHIYKTRTEAIQAICDDVVEAAEIGRPVMVGAQSVSDAEDVYKQLRQKLPSFTRLGILTGKNDQELFTFFDRAGEPHSVLVVTQLAGRGIDIRLTDESREKGGILLIGFTHALERRLDKQFLGRVGRQGDPFAAYYISSFEDNFLKRFAPEWTKSALTSLGWKRGEMIESKQIMRQFFKLQRLNRRSRIGRDLGQIYLDDANEAAFLGIRNWFEYQQLDDSSPQQEPSDDCAAPFLDFALDHFLSETTRGILSTSRPLSRQAAEFVADVIAESLAIERKALPFKPHDVEDYKGKDASRVIKENLLNALCSAATENKEVRKKIHATWVALSELSTQSHVYEQWYTRLEKMIPTIWHSSDASQTNTNKTVDGVSNEQYQAGRGLNGTDTEVEPQDQKLIDGFKETGITNSDVLAAWSHEGVNYHLDDDLRSSLSTDVQKLWDIRDELYRQNQYLEEHPRAREDVACRKVIELCKRVDLDDTITVTQDNRRIKLIIIGPIHRPHSTVEDSMMDMIKNEVLMTEWTLSIVQMILAGDIEIEEAEGKLENRKSFVASTDPHSDPLRRIRDLLRSVEHRIERLRNESEKIYADLDVHLLGRTPRKIANWTIRHASAELLDECNRIIHKAWQMDYKVLLYYRSVYDGTLHAWSNVDSTLSSRIIRNLLKCADPNTLDDLFWLEDHRDVSAPIDTSRPSLSWVSLTDEQSVASQDTKCLQLVNQFIEQNIDRIFSANLQESSLRRLLMDFMKKSPLHSLRSPVHVLDAIDNWFRIDRERGLTLSRTRLHRRWLGRFMIFLRRRKLVGKLPTFQTRCFAWGKRLITSFFEYSTMMLLVPSLAFLVVFILLSIYGNWLQSVALSGILGYLDKIVFGGLLQFGSVTAPAIGGLILGAATTRFIQTHHQDESDGLGLDRIITPLFQIGIAVWLTQWSGHKSWLELLVSLGSFVGALCLSLITNSVVWFTSLQTGISMKSGWFSFAIPFVLWRYMFDKNQIMPAVISYGALVVFTVLYYLWSNWNFKEIVVMSARLPSAVEVDDVEYVRTSYKVSGDCGSHPHVYALMISLLVFLLISSVDFQFFQRWIGNVMAVPLIITSVYGFTVFAWCGVMLSRRFSPFTWRQILNQKRQVLAGVESKDQMTLTLKRLQNSVLCREFIFQMCIFLIPSIILHGQTVSSTSFPLALLLICSAVFFSNQLRSFCIQCYRHAISRIPVVEHELDLSNMKEPLDAVDRGERVKLFLKNRFEIVITVLAIIFGAISLVKPILKFVIELFVMNSP